MPRGVYGNTAATLYNPLTERGQVFHLALAHELVKSADGKAFEVGGGAMEVARTPIPVLLVDDDSIGIVFSGVRYIGDATRLLPGCRGQLAENVSHLLAVFGREPHTNDEADHGAFNLLDQEE